jgi:hypothetical protein
MSEYIPGVEGWSNAITVLIEQLKELRLQPGMILCHPDDYKIFRQRFKNLQLVRRLNPPNESHIKRTRRNRH